MLAFSFFWIVFATVAVVFATVRKFASIEDTGRVEADSTESNRGGVIDRWGKVVTGVAVFYCLAILSGFLYIGWQNGQQILK